MSKTELLAKLKAETIALSQMLPMHPAFQLNGLTAHLPLAAHGMDSIPVLLWVPK